MCAEYFAGAAELGIQGIKLRTLILKVQSRHDYFAYQIDVFTSLQFEIVTV